MCNGFMLLVPVKVEASGYAFSNSCMTTAGASWSQATCNVSVGTQFSGKMDLLIVVVVVCVRKGAN